MSLLMRVSVMAVLRKVLDSPGRELWSSMAQWVLLGSWISTMRKEVWLATAEVEKEKEKCIVGLLP